MRDSGRFPTEELRHVGCPRSCLHTSAALAALGAALWVLVPRSSPLRHPIDEGLPIYLIGPFLLVLAAHLGAFGKIRSARPSRASLEELARRLGGRLFRDPLSSDLLRIRARVGERRFDLEVSESGSSDRPASLRLAAPSPLAFVVTSREEEDPRNPGFRARYELEAVECAHMSGEELFARVPRLRAALIRAIRRSVRRIEVGEDAVTAHVEPSFLDSPEIAARIVEGLALVADALGALAAAPQVLDLSIALAPRSPTHCPYCKDALASGEQVRCQACETLHHRECFEEHGACSVLGCGGARPVPLAEKA